MARAGRRATKTATRRTVRCYYCGELSDVSGKTMSTACPSCHKAIKVEDITVKNYTPVNDLQTCGKITITRRGRVAARLIQCGEGIECLGIAEGAIETDGPVELGPQAEWKGVELQCASLRVVDGAKINGMINVPWNRGEKN